MVRPLERAEQRLREDAAPDIRLAVNDQEWARRAAENAMRNAAKKPSDNDLRKLALELRAKEQLIVVAEIPRLIAANSTPESISDLLVKQNGRIAIISAEGESFKILGGRYKNGEPDLEDVNKAYSGDTIVTDRMTGGHSRTTSPRSRSRSRSSPRSSTSSTRRATS